MELKEVLLCSLKERLVQHDNNRKEIQNQLEEICTKFAKEVDLVEENVNESIQELFNLIEERILGHIEKLNNSEGGDEKDPLIKQLQKELPTEPRYEFQLLDDIDSIVYSYTLEISPVEEDYDSWDENDIEKIISYLQERLNKAHEILVSAQSKSSKISTKKRNEIEQIRKRINEKLEFHFTREDARIQEVVNMVNEKNRINENNDEELITKAKLTLLKNQKYTLNSDNELIITRELSLNWIDFEERKPSIKFVSFMDTGKLSILFTFFSDDEIEVLNTATEPTFKIIIKIWEKNNSNEEENAKVITKEYTLGDKELCFVELFNPNTAYTVKMRIEYSYDKLCTKWSDNAEFTTPGFKGLCFWEKCPEYVKYGIGKYSVDENNPRIATKVSDGFCSTIIGSTSIPLNEVTSWNIKILKSRYNNGGNIYVGVSPFDIDPNNIDNYKYGWYFDCYESMLYSGLPHKYFKKEHGQRKEDGQYVHTGDSVGVVIDTEKGELSFTLNEINYGVAYEGIPLDKPLVPCVLLWYEGDSVEFDTSRIKENINNSISVPSNITTNSDTCNSITLAWDGVEGASFYQIEVDNCNLYYVSTENEFTKRGFLPETEHTFRIRTVKGTLLSEWSKIIKGKTLKKPGFPGCVWKECPDDVDEGRKYFVDENNPKIATKIGGDYDYCTIIGTKPFPLSKVSSWSIKILKSRDNDGFIIYVGVAPSDINQNEEDNFKKCGWYFYCYQSTLLSGPPHNYEGKDYGPRKGEDEKYVYSGDIISVTMNTTKGEFSFILDGVNLGIAYEGIPLDKPLVPCVILGYEGDCVEIE